MTSFLNLNQILNYSSKALQNRNKTNLRFLYLFIIINCIYATLLELQHFIKFDDNVINCLINFPLSFLTGPIIYYYFRDEIFKYEPLKLRDLYHFLPLVIYFVYIGAINIEINNLLFKFKSTLEIHSISTSSFLYLIRILQIFTYFTIGLMHCYNRYGLNFIKKNKLALLSPYILIYLTLITLAFYPQVYFLFLGQFDVEYSFTHSIAIIILIGFTIRLTVDRFPQIAESVQIIIQDENNQQNRYKKDIILTDQQLKIYSNIINQYISTKPTRDTKFNKNQLVSAVCLPEYLVNCYFNQHLGTSFGNWKTNQRIIDGVDLIEKGFLRSKTIESLAKEVGFSSRSRFVEAFLKIKGCTPTEYHAQYYKS